MKHFEEHSVLKWRKIQAKFLNKILENFMGKAFKVQVGKKILTKRDCFLSSRYQGGAIFPAHMLNLNQVCHFIAWHDVGLILYKY